MHLKYEIELLLSRGYLRELVSKDPIKEKKDSLLLDRCNQPKIPVLGEEQHGDVDRNVRIFHTIHGGSNMFGLSKNW